MSQSTNSIQVSAPAVLAVDLEALKTYLKIDGSDLDAEIEAICKAAIMRLENHVGFKFITQTWDIFFDSFGQMSRDVWWDGSREGAIGDMFSSSTYIQLPFGRLNSVTSLVTTGDDGVDELFNPTNYTFDSVSNSPKVSLRQGSQWPTTTLRGSNGIRVRGVFGMGAAPANIPSDIQLAIMLTTSKMFENRGDSPSGEFFGVGGFTIPNTAQMLLMPYVHHKVG